MAQKIDIKLPPVTTKVVEVAIADRVAQKFSVDNQVPIPDKLLFGTFDFPMNEADKLAEGLEIVLETEFSSDGGASWNFVNGTTWRSYGPKGLTVTDPDGTVRVNPDPRLQVPLAQKANQLFRVNIHPKSQMPIGCKVSVTG